MTTNKEALRLAREALNVSTTPLPEDRQTVLRAIAAIDSAISQQAAQEPQPATFAGRVFVDQLTGRRAAVLSPYGKTLPDMARLYAAAPAAPQGEQTK